MWRSCVCFGCTGSSERARLCWRLCTGSAVQVLFGLSLCFGLLPLPFHFRRRRRIRWGDSDHHRAPRSQCHSRGSKSLWGFFFFFKRSSAILPLPPPKGGGRGKMAELRKETFFFSKWMDFPRHCSSLLMSEGVPDSLSTNVCIAQNIFFWRLKASLSEAMKKGPTFLSLLLFGFWCILSPHGCRREVW